MKRNAVIFLLIASCSLVHAGSLTDFLKLRKQLGISRATTAAALETLVGKRTLEVSGLVKGCVTSGESGWLYLETSDGGELNIKASAIPEWLRMGDVRARMLIKADRANENASLHAELIAVYSDEEVAKYEKAHTPAPKREIKNTPSRGGEVIARAVTKNWNLPASEAQPYYAAFIRNYNKRLTQAQADEIARGVIGFSIQYGVDARLIMSIVMCESGFNPRDVSHTGATGLGQLMPGTARELGVKDRFDTNENLFGTVKLIRQHLDRYSATSDDPFEALVLSIAAYNAGAGAVKRHGGVPPYRETQNYVQKVIRTYRQLCGE